jgi:hypothetical protein
MNVIIIWLILWFGVMGLPNLLFKKYKITYHENSWSHTIFYFLSILVLFLVYKNPFYIYFSDLTLGFKLILLSLFVLWLVIPTIYKNDYYANRMERFRYQLPKFFEILFQQFCFLGGLLTFEISPLSFGLVFFAVHIPVIFVIPKKFALFFTFGSLFGGLIFASLQSYGVNGFLLSLLIHLLFYIIFHYALTVKNLLRVTPHRR